MSIAFNPEDWSRVTAAHDAWWDRTLDRPLISVTLGGREPDRPEPDLPVERVTARYPADVRPEAIVDRWDYELSRCEWLGDAFPTIRPNFGPGCNAAFLGAVLEATEQTAWFHPEKEVELPDLHLTYDPDNPWLRRVEVICAAAAACWSGEVCVGMCDLTPNLDTLSIFRPSEKLLLDLYDHPETVERLVTEAADIFWQHFRRLHAAMTPPNPGYTCWLALLSTQPYYCLQCDFCYMIGPEMFDRFVRPDLVDGARSIPRTIYHLDGPGQLPHLDSLLSIEELDGVQWIPGAGQKPESEWLEVYERIHAAGKLIVIHSGFDMLDRLADRLGTARGIALLTGAGPGGRTEAEKQLARWGVTG